MFCPNPVKYVRRCFVPETINDYVRIAIPVNIGNISAIVYSEYLEENGWPKTQGVSWDPYFTEAYYRREVPVWQSYAPGLFSDAGKDWRLMFRIACLAIAAGILIALGATGFRRPRSS